MLAPATRQAASVPGCCLSLAVRWFSDTARKKWQVSSLGRCRDTRGRITFGYLRSSKYYYVMIARQMWPVHILVKQTFHGPPPSKEANEVHHIDGRSQNNSLDNLAYVTRSQNMKHFFASAARVSIEPSSKRPVMRRPVGFATWITSPSISEASEEFGISARNLSKYCQLNSTIDGYEYAFAGLEQLSLPGEKWRQLIDPQSSKVVDGNLVSSYGRLRFKSGHISRGTFLPSGYLRFNYACNGAHRSVGVHRLVVRSFLGPPPTRQHTHINHKDGIKANNDLCNLEYATPRENRAHFLQSAEESGRRTTSTKPVCSRLASEKDWQWHASMKQAASTLGFDAGSISRWARGVQKHAGNYEFRLATAEGPKVLPGEEWRQIDLEALLREKEARKNRSSDLI